jgi:hypothetical protein
MASKLASTLALPRGQLPPLLEVRAGTTVIIGYLICVACEVVRLVSRNYVLLSR